MQRTLVTLSPGPRSSICTVAVGVLLSLGLVGCSAGDEPDLGNAGLGESPGEVGAAVVEAGRSWGDGRATWASHTGSTTSIVTTTGVFTKQDGQAPVGADRFSSALRVTAAAVDAEGGTLALATTDQRIRAVDLATGGLAAEQELPLDISVRDLAYNHNGVLVADTSAGPLVWVDGLAAEPLRLVGDAPAGRMALLADATVAAPVRASAALVVLRDGTRRDYTLDLDDGATALDADASASGRLAVSIGIGENPFEREDRIVVLDPTSFEPLATIDAGMLLDDPSWVATDAAIAAWNGPGLALWSYDGQPITTGETPTDRPIVAVHEVAGALVSAHSDGTLVRWPTDTWSPTVIAPGGITLVHLSVDASGDTLTAVDFYGRVTTRSAADGVVITDDDRFAVGELTGVAVSADGSQIGVASSTGDISVLGADLTERWSTPATSEGGKVDAIAFDPSSGAVTAGVAERVGDLAFDDTVAFWDPAGGTERFRVGGEAEDVAGCAFYFSRVRYNGDGSLVAVTSHDYSVLVLDSTTGEVLHELPGSTTVLDLAFSPDDDLLVATYDNSEVTVWSTGDFSVAATYQGAMGGYFGIGVLPDSATMAATDITGAISLVDLMTGAVVGSLDGADHRTSAIAVSPDGSLVAAPTTDAGVAIWSANSGRHLATAHGHTATVTGLAFAPDGSYLVSSSSDGTIRTWSIATHT
ncbi:MAG: hypothetical protein R8G01_09295 [Ilumatobacteraceae bacterium]|nr:hypothetical protein [Ilumatobacteraceae bacterium]